MKLQLVLIATLASFPYASAGRLLVHSQVDAPGIGLRAGIDTDQVGEPNDNNDSHRLLQSSGNYCGSTWTAASQCSQACPGGVDSECPTGESCFAEVTCSSSGGDVGGGGTAGNYCGSTWTAATQCSQACPGGVDGECPTGEMCFGAVTCSPSRARTLMTSDQLPFMCNICGDNQTITIPDATVFIPDYGNYTCSEIEAAGENGLISENDCPVVKCFGVTCGCSVPPTPPTRYLRHL